MKPLWRLAVVATIAVAVLSLLVFSIGKDSGSAPPARPAPSRPGDIHLARAEAHRRAGDLRAALDETQRAIGADPDLVAAYLLHSELLFASHRADEMIPPLLEAIELEPSRFEARANLAYALRYAGRLDEAEEQARWCLARRPDFLPVRQVLAEVHRDRGDIDRALREVREALRIDPENVGLRLLEADLLIYHREFESAYLRLEPLLEHHGANPRFRSALARAARLSGRTDEAARHQSELGRLLEKH